ncbi:MAG: glycosyltransferase family 39 protein [Deltaproteobacteria bacterium]|nr:glycosyltransferase family 39 protein [Deltaproteobacteria bacterium]
MKIVAALKSDRAPFRALLALAAVIALGAFAAILSVRPIVVAAGYAGALVLTALVAIALMRLPRVWRSNKGRIGFALAVFTLGLHALAARDTGFTDDDDFYIRAGRLYADWFLGKGAFAGGSKLDRANLDRAWNCRYPCNPEHPPVAKAAIGAARWLFADATRLTSELIAARLGIALLATLLILLVFAITWDEVSPRAGVAAATLLLTMPRFFFDSHVPTLDVATAATYFLTAFAFWYGLRSHTWGLAAGFAFGLALLTKLNAPFALVPLGLYFIYHAQGAIRRDGGLLRLGPLPLNLPAMLVLGPLLFFALWPRLWTNTFEHLKWWFEFHSKHYGILFFYRGTVFHQDPFAPWHAPIVMTAITTPVVTYALSLLGLAEALWVNARAALARLAKPAQAGDFNAKALSRKGAKTEAPSLGVSASLRLTSSPPADFLLFITLNAAVTIGILIVPNIPSYGGVKLFAPFFPFLAILAGVGFDRVLCAASRLATDIATARPRFAFITKRPRLRDAAVCVFLLAPAALELAYIHPYELSYYSPLIGGTRGAVHHGFERQYYDVFYKDLVVWLNAQSQTRDIRVTFLPNNGEYQRSAPWLHDNNELSRRVQIVGLWDADVLILTHERRWPHYPDLFRALSKLTPAMDLRVEGVSLATAYVWSRGAAFQSVVTNP